MVTPLWDRQKPPPPPTPPPPTFLEKGVACKKRTCLEAALMYSGHQKYARIKYISKFSYISAYMKGIAGHVIVEALRR